MGWSDIYMERHAIQPPLPEGAPTYMDSTLAGPPIDFLERENGVLRAALERIAASYQWEPFDDREVVSQPTNRRFAREQPTNRRIAREALEEVARG